MFVGILIAYGTLDQPFCFECSCFFLDLVCQCCGQWLFCHLDHCEEFHMGKDILLESFANFGSSIRLLSFLISSFLLIPRFFCSKVLYFFNQWSIKDLEIYYFFDAWFTEICSFWTCDNGHWLPGNLGRTVIGILYPIVSKIDQGPVEL